METELKWASRTEWTMETELEWVMGAERLLLLLRLFLKGRLFLQRPRRQCDSLPVKAVLLPEEQSVSGCDFLSA